MGESSKFVSYTVNSSVDVEVIAAGLPAQTLKAGEIAGQAVVELTAAAQAGDAAAAALAEAKLAQALDAVKNLGEVRAQLNAFIVPEPV
jgi:hypothetical protein